MRQHFYSLLDLLAPIYIAIFYLISKSIVSRNDNNELYRKYFLQGFWYKMLGAFGFYLIYAFYYDGGDSCAYFINGTAMNEYLVSQDFTEGIKVIFTSGVGYDNFPPWIINKSAFVYDFGYVLRDTKALMVAKISSIVSLPCFNSYLCTCLAFGFLSYIPIFKLYTLLCSIYPDKADRLSFAFLKVPSFVFWGSSVSKDTICVTFLCILIYTFYKVVVEFRFSIKYIVLFVISVYFIFVIKSYILFAALPGFLIFAFITYQNKLLKGSIKYLVTPIVLMLAVGVFILLFQSLANTYTEFSVENLETRAEGFKSDHTNIQERLGGSGYSLGNFDYTVSGILQKAPLAIAITLFGPFPWEIRNPVMLLSSLESNYFLYLFVTAIFSAYGLSRLGKLLGDPVFLFSLTFVIILGISIGITSFNYGALVRFKIPILPFFATMLLLMEKPKPQQSSF